MKKQKKIKKAFSLVEICVVCAILSFLWVPLFTLMSKGSSGTIRNRNEILAQQYASNVIAYCNILKFDDDFLKETEEKIIGSGTLNLTLANDIKINMDITEESFSKIATRTISIRDYNPSNSISYFPYKYKIITSKVEWFQQGENKIRNVTITGLVYNIKQENENEK